MTQSQNLTKNQRAVLDALTASSVPMSAYDLLDLDDIRAKGLKAPLTIYRALDKLRDFNLVHRIESLNAYVACGTAPHDEPVGFLSCEKCRTTVELPIDKCEKILQSAAKSSGFTIDKMVVEVSGKCAKCG